MRWLLVAALAGCSAPAPPSELQSPGVPARVDPGDAPPAPGDAADVPPAVGPLTVRFIGVAGYVVRYGVDAVLTVTMFSNPSMDQVMFGDIAPDHARVDRFLGDTSLAGVRAILSGHAHYDHLLDAAYLWTKCDGARIYANLSAQRLLAGFAPEPPEGCEPRAEPPPSLLPRDAVVALDELADNRVDTRNCAGLPSCASESQPAQRGRWLYVPDSRVRLLALCSAHPDHFAGFHFGRGCVETPHCSPPVKADAWREGDTLAFLVDFLDEGGAPVHRVYYQDSPTDAPLGHVPDDLLAEKRVDLALLNVGSYDQVRDHPGEIIAHLAPRYVLAGHWENFFLAQDQPLQPIPFLDLEEFRARLAAAMPPDSAWVPEPGALFVLPAVPWHHLITLPVPLPRKTP